MSCTEDRTDGQAKAVSNTLMIRVSRATAPATRAQDDGDEVSLGGETGTAMSTPSKENGCSLYDGARRVTTCQE
ncbi:hypothetical protein GCM10020358_61560 [Amorphoplanes nipponensis]|uniref:Uncharacterized protein n=1 Tax=Actinoplanes nipponensis TaxID=135950 RepID=A0A919MLH5_9ACTN|nr:hypothetical protein Ani05nite_74930 [Actinoplanes nipponensis]